MLNGLDLFSGIGGLALALAPWVRPIAYCECEIRSTKPKTLSHSKLVSYASLALALIGAVLFVLTDWPFMGLWWAFSAGVALACIVVDHAMTLGGGG